MRALLSIVVSLVGWSAAAQDPPQRITAVGKFSGNGFVDHIQPGEIVIRSPHGKRQSFLIQDQDERYLSLDGDQYIVAMPARITVGGRLPGELLEQGMIVEFQANVNQLGRSEQPVKRLKIIAGDERDLKIAPAAEPTDKNFVPCDFVGIIQRFYNNNMYLVVPKSRITPQRRIHIKVAADATFDIASNDLNRVRTGDRIHSFSGVTLSNGAMVILEIDIELTAKREVATPSYSEQLYQKYSKLPDDPVAVREERSDHFVLFTDISPRSAAVLLEKLETMYGFLSRYYRTRPRETIECYVVADLDNFRGKIPAIGVTKIRQAAGVTASQHWALRRGSRIDGKVTKSIVYACDDHNVVQHEAVHAFCNMAFGNSGPIWYSEGMAEIGNYWVPDQQAIRIEPAVIAYLTKAEKKRMADIVAAGQITGDSWQAYAWRWALCHLLFSNPNYSERFRELGIHMMMGKKDSFDKAFGKVQDKISFEYDQFVANFDNGYRADLCVWQWVEDAQALIDLGEITVLAKQGWQASSILLEQGQSYDFVCPTVESQNGERAQQTWQISDLFKPVTAQGNPRGDGKLVGAIFHDYQLSEPFEIGVKRNGFVAPASGQLYLRCRESWNALSDNDGQITVYLRKTIVP